MPHRGILDNVVKQTIGADRKKSDNIQWQIANNEKVPYYLVRKIDAGVRCTSPMFYNNVKVLKALFLIEV